MQLCEYGCGREAKYQFKNGKWCCSKNHAKCPKLRKVRSIRSKELWKDPNSGLNSILKETRSKNMKNARKDPNSKYNSKSYKENHSNKMKDSWRNPTSGLNSDSCKEKKSNSMIEIWDDPNSVYYSDLYKEKQRNSLKEKWDDPDSAFNSETRSKKISKVIIEAWNNLDSKLNSDIYRKKLSVLSKNTIEKINIKYPFFSKIEEMRYNPNKPEEKEIQVHCKNHNCKNSKEKDGWFIPTLQQIKDRKDFLENEGIDRSNFYCSQHCKDTCPLYNLKGDPYKNTNLPYTPGEIQVYNKTVLEREKGLCEYCGEPAEHVHHIFPKKLGPFFALDPDYGVACCAKHHYKYAHRDECSTGNLAKIVCSVESQKFLNQTLEDI